MQLLPACCPQWLHKFFTCRRPKIPLHAQFLLPVQYNQGEKKPFLVNMVLLRRVCGYEAYIFVTLTLV